MTKETFQGGDSQRINFIQDEDGYYQVITGAEEPASQQTTQIEKDRPGHNKGSRRKTRGGSQNFQR